MPQDVCFSDLKFIIEFVYRGEIDVSQAELQVCNNYFPVFKLLRCSYESMGLISTDAEDNFHIGIRKLVTIRNYKSTSLSQLLLVMIMFCACCSQVTPNGSVCKTVYVN
jgi:hypothetical protein